MKFKKIALFITLCATFTYFGSNSFALEQQTLGGSDRVETSILVANETKNNTSIIIASGNKSKLVDSLVFGIFSTKTNSPILLNSSAEKIDSRILEYIKERKINKVYIAGGTSSISPFIEDTFKKMNITTERISGNTRYSTAIEVYQRTKSDNGFFVVGGNSLPDAVSISPISSILNKPILLVSDNEPIKINEGNKPYTIIGGKDSVSNKLFPSADNLRISGNDRYETNIEIIKYFRSKINTKNIVVTTGENDYLADALVAGPYASKNNSPVIFDIKKYMTSLSIKISDINKITFIGKRVENNGQKKILETLLNNSVNENSNPSSSTNTSNNSGGTTEPEKVELEETTGLPRKYDLRNVDKKSYVTSVKNQFYDGGCRSFASLSALESHIKLKLGKDVDLSENNMENRNGFFFKNSNNKKGIRDGRNRESDLPYLISNLGPILESEDPYIPIKNDSFTPAPYLSKDAIAHIKSDNLKYLSRSEVESAAENPIVKPASFSVMGFEFLKSLSPKDIDSSESISMKQIKESIIKNGAVVSNIYMEHDGNKTFPYSNINTYNPDKYAYFSSKDLGSNLYPNHAVSIVGWDDDFKKENFVSNNQPAIDGAWIVKDAQSEYFGEKGYYYVSFQSAGICSEPYVFTDVRENNIFDGIYDHGVLAFTGYIKSDLLVDEGYKNVLFNVHTPSSLNQELKYIGFYTTKPNADYEVYFIDDFEKFNKTSRVLEQDELYDEIQQYKISSGKAETAGYHIIDLDKIKASKLLSNKKFALGIFTKNSDLEDPEHKWDIVMEQNILEPNGRNLGKEAVIGKGETYAITFGGLMDINKFSNNKSGNGNATVKGYYIQK